MHFAEVYKNLKINRSTFNRVKYFTCNLKKKEKFKLNKCYLALSITSRLSETNLSCNDFHLTEFVNVNFFFLI